MSLLLRKRLLLPALGLSLITFVLLSWIPIFGPALNYLSDSSLPLSETTRIVVHLLLQSLGDNVVVYPFISVLSLAVGINLSVLIYFARTYRPGIPVRGLPPNIAGYIASIVGIGCAACGVTFFGAFSASISGFIVALPLSGAWIGYLGLALLVFSTWQLLRAINKTER